MTRLRAEGGPFDGETFEVVDTASVVRIPVMVDPTRPAAVDSVSTPFVEYRRSGRVLRWSGLVDDAWAYGRIVAEAFREAGPRAELRAMVRDQLERLAAERGQVVDRIVWAMAFDTGRSEYHVVGVVGGRRVERAEAFRINLRRDHG